MARDADDINSAETSFSFVLGRARELDGKFTIFGELEWGQPLLAAIAREPRDKQNRPMNPILVEKAEVKTGAEIAQLRAGGQLKAVQPLPKPVRAPRPVSRH